MPATIRSTNFCLQYAIQKYAVSNIQNYNFACCSYGYNTWSLTLRVFKRRVLRKIFGPKRDEAIGDLRRLYNEKLHGL